MNTLTESYLADLTRALGRVEPGERADIVDQIRDHIDARITELGHDPSEPEMNAILAELGDPQLVAAAWDPPAPGAVPDAAASSARPAPFTGVGAAGAVPDVSTEPVLGAAPGPGATPAPGAVPGVAPGAGPGAGPRVAPGAPATPGPVPTAAADPLRPQRQRAGLLIALGAVSVLVSPLPFIGLVLAIGVLVAAIVCYRRGDRVPEVTNLLWIAIILAGLGVMGGLLVSLGLAAFSTLRTSVGSITSVG